MSIWRRATVGMASCALLAGVQLATPATHAVGGSVIASSSVRSTAPTVGTYDRVLLAFINHARTIRKIPPLRMTMPLYLSARGWSRHLMATRNLVHDPNLRRSVSVLGGCKGVTAWGENVAYSPAGAASMFAMYMKSPGHRANILERSYTHVGVATVAVPGRYGKTNWNTMKFVGGRCT